VVVAPRDSHPLRICAPDTLAEAQAVAYLLPPLFALDNLISAASPLPAGLISCAMAAAGFVLGAAVLNRRAPPAPRPLWAAGLTVLGIALQLAG